MGIRIRKVAVLGAGVMGSGIAAHLANAGIPVLLLDIVPPGAGPGERNKFALSALANLKKAKPATSKGVYVKKVTLSTTMGPGLAIDQASLTA